MKQIGKVVLLFQALLCLFTTQTRANTTSSKCRNSTGFTPNNTFQSNRETLFSSLASNATNNRTGFHTSSAGINHPDVVYGAFLCRGDVSMEFCSDCVSKAIKAALEWCPQSNDGIVWMDECMLRYAPQPLFLGETDESVKDTRANNELILWTDPNRFENVLGKTLDDIATRASAGDRSGKRFAVGQANFSALQTLFALAQCTPDLNTLECNRCLRKCISDFASCCVGRLGARILYPSCTVRYEVYLFYNATAIAPPPSPPPLPPLPPPPPVKPKREISTGVLVAIILPIVLSILLLFNLGFCWLTRKKLIFKRYYSVRGDNNGDNDDITTEHSLQYDLGTIQSATNNFSPENKIGEGGFGSVYKGILCGGKEIAVKRLSKSSGQGAAEFKNEVLVVAKLHHRNLVRLLGYCLEAEEKILIYEYVANRSLDYLLFDSKEGVKLDWSIRYKIIGGIARGMLYLHEDSCLTIIHRDLKASNILLDGDMNAKVSDFGMAKIFGVDQTRGNTGRVVGTYGYMSPEYVIHGQFSVKSDVFSFGVLLLEIVTGKKNNSRYRSEIGDDLLSHAWMLWREGNHLNLIDPVLEESYSRSEVTRCIHIGLLCVQNNPDARPSMANVVLMLNSYSVTLSVPQEPAFFSRTRACSNLQNNMSDSDQSTSQSVHLSINDDPITEVHA